MFWENQDLFCHIAQQKKQIKKTSHFFISFIIQSLIVCFLTELNEHM